jgi:hypothetical protein
MRRRMAAWLLGVITHEELKSANPWPFLALGVQLSWVI